MVPRVTLRAFLAEHGFTFEAFSRANRHRCESPQGFNHTLNSWSTSDWFLAVLGELGEAANNAKKLNRVRDGIPGNKETPDELRAKLRKECGDVFVYLDLLAQANGFSIADAAVEVFDAKSNDLGYEPDYSALLAYEQRQREVMPSDSVGQRHLESPAIAGAQHPADNTAPVAYAQRQGWQPIETAPKDGTWILAAGVDGSLSRISWGRTRQGELAWCTANGWCAFRYLLGWMPLPPLPSPPQEPT